MPSRSPSHRQNLQNTISPPVATFYFRAAAEKKALKILPAARTVPQDKVIFIFMNTCQFDMTL